MSMVSLWKLVSKQHSHFLTAKVDQNFCKWAKFMPVLAGRLVTFFSAIIILNFAKNAGLSFFTKVQIRAFPLVEAIDFKPLLTCLASET